MRSRLAVSLLATTLLRGVASAWAQAPVREGELAAALIGTVSDSAGAVIPGAEVSATNLQRGTESRSTTGSDGRFILRSLEPGQYRVKVMVSGFATAQRDVSLGTGKSAQVDFALAVGPVAEGEIPRPASPSPSPSGPAPTARKVLARQAKDDAELQAWLNGQASAGQELLAVIVKRPGESYFVFGDTAGAAPPLVLTVSGALGPEQLQARIDLHPHKRLLGIHLLSGSYLMIFADAR